MQQSRVDLGGMPFGFGRSAPLLHRVGGVVERAVWKVVTHYLTAVHIDGDTVVRHP